MSPTEYAKHAGVSTETIRRWIRVGKIRAEPINGKYSIPHDTTQPPHDTTHTAHPHTQTAIKIELAQLRAQVEKQTVNLATLKQTLASNAALVAFLFEKGKSQKQTLDDVLKSQREAQERADTILLSLTQQKKQQQVFQKDFRERNVPLVKKVLSWLRWRNA